MTDRRSFLYGGEKKHQQIMSYAEVVSFIICPLMQFFVNLYTPSVNEAGLKLTEVRHN